MSIKDVRFGFDYTTDTDVHTSMETMREWELTFVSLPVSSLKLKTNSVSDQPSPIMNPEFSEIWCHCIIAKIADNIDVDSPDDNIRLENEKTLVKDISWTMFLNVYSLMLELPMDGDFSNLTRLLDNQIDTYLNTAMSIQFWISIPIVNSKNDPWTKWTKFISSVRNVSKMRLVLEVGSELPSDEVLDRWLGEPVVSIIIQADVFLRNKKCYPVLPKLHQEFIKKMFNVGCQILISGESVVKQHFNYLAHLYDNTAPLTPYSSEFVSGFEDYLQTPLQPLKNNLQSYVYETFEQDPVKYYLYERAIFEALKDLSEHSESIVVYVVGAGRGPLVDATLNAAKELGIVVKVFAVEKNKNALPTLYLKNKENWHDRVTIVDGDMRFWKPEQKCDIIVSELLGSFGDNELSPECLDGAQGCLKDNGISIPSSYTSFLGPVQSRKLHAEISFIKDNKIKSNFQKPYVVQLNNVYTIAPAKPLFTFAHPNVEDGDNDRDGVLTFAVSQDCVLHGFAGYFETVLYKNINLSIVPETFSEGMFSWFPVLFPVIDPMALYKGDQLQINFWRCSSKYKVWYEWCVAKPHQSVVHNVNGEMYSMSL